LQHIEVALETGFGFPDLDCEDFPGYEYASQAEKAGKVGQTSHHFEALKVQK
jgi:hypothetical protein